MYINALARVTHLASSGSSIPAGCIELALCKKNQGVIYELELYLNRLTHLLGAGQAQLDGKVKLSTPDEAWLYIRSTLSNI